MTTEGVIIAAGQSKRMSPDLKLLLTIDDESVIRRSIFSMMPFVSRLIIVTGYHHDAVLHHIEDIQGIETIFNCNYMEGMYSSVIAGLSATRGEHAFLLPADCPFVCPQVYKKMSVLDDDIVVPFYQGKPGHPVRLSRNAIDSLLKENHESLRAFIQHNPHQRIEVECSGILIDIDTMDDYQQALKFHKNKEGYLERNQ